MKIRTLENLSDSLDKELAWRKKELSILFSFIQRNQRKPRNLEALIRSGVTVLYAHWEGFVKASGTAYIEYVARQDLQYKDMALEFRAIAIKKMLNTTVFTEPNKAQGLITVIDFLLNRQEEKCRISWQKTVNTKSNLDSQVLKEIVITLGLNYSHFETKEKLIDHTLLHYRNNIAHGKEMYPTYDLFEELYREILGLIEIFRNQIENAAFTETYKI